MSQLVRETATTMQEFTQQGVRPFGVSLLMAGTTTAAQSVSGGSERFVFRVEGERHR